MVKHYAIERGHCLHAARVALSVCEHYGIEAEPQFGGCHAFNRKGWRLFKSQLPADEWPDSAWGVSVMMESPPVPPSVGGHAFVTATQDGEHYLIDLSAEMFSRPERGIILPPLCLPLSETFSTFNWKGQGFFRAWRVGKTIVAYSGGTPECVAPWDRPIIPVGWNLNRNKLQINELIEHIDVQLQSRQHGE